MVMCWAPGCNHYNVRETCKFFKFPSNKQKRARWIELFRRAEQPGPGAYLCSCHFEDGKRQNGPTIFEYNGKKRFMLKDPEKKKPRRRKFPDMSLVDSSVPISSSLPPSDGKRLKGTTGTICAMALCKNSYKYRHKDPKNKLSFHVFPKNPEIHKKWVQFCRRKDNFNTTYAALCSAHFKPEDFQRDLQAELLNLPPKRLLKPGTVPCIDFPISNSRISESPSLSDDDERLMVTPHIPDDSSVTLTDEELEINAKQSRIFKEITFEELNSDPLTCFADVLSNHELLQKNEDFKFCLFLFHEMQILSNDAKYNVRKSVQHSLLQAYEQDGLGT